jgi:hypothetical protein
MIEKYEKKLEAEIKRIEAETNQLNKKWYKKFDNILKVLIFMVGGGSLYLFSTLYNINNERLKLERAELKRDIEEFTFEKDSLYNQISNLNALSDSLTLNIYKLYDSITFQKNNYSYIQSKLSKKESRIIFLVQELERLKSGQSSKQLKQKLSNLLKLEADAGPDMSICIGDRATLTASGGERYLWSTGETTSEIVVSPQKTTIYTVKVFNGNSSDIDSVKVIINDNSLDLGNGISICGGSVINLN